MATRPGYRRDVAVAIQVENRRKLVDQQTALLNQLTDLLKLYYPQIVLWFPDVTTLLVGDLLLRWPPLRELQKAKAAALEKFFHQHNCHNQQMIQQRLDQIRRAIPATRDEAVISSARCLALVCVQQITCWRRAIGELDNEIAELTCQQPAWEIFDSLPGAGEVLAPRLIAALGSSRERFASAVELRCFSGIAPAKWPHALDLSEILCQSFHEWAACSIHFCDWAKACYDQQRSRKKSHHTAIRALAFKRIPILYRCWKIASRTGKRSTCSAGLNEILLFCRASPSLCKCRESLHWGCEEIRFFPLDGLTQISSIWITCADSGAASFRLCPAIHVLSN